MPGKRPLTAEQLAAVVREAFGPGAVLTGGRELTEGTSNAAHLLELADGRRAVVKAAPPAGVPVLTYEHGLLATEARCLRAFAGLAPVPQLLHAGLGETAVGREFVVTSVLPGASWWSQRDRVTDVQRGALRRQLGRHVAALHRVTGERFGYPAPGSPLVGETWPAAYRRIIGALLADADRFGVALPPSTGEVLDAAAELLAPVTTPVLVHFDLWDGNVFVDLERTAVTGLIDAERALWADPAADLVSLSLSGPLGADFLAGYAEAGGPVVLDDATRQRLQLYRAHLALVMMIEPTPRGVPVAEAERTRAWVAPWLTEAFAALG